MKRLLQIVQVFLLASVFSACSGQFKNKVEFDTSEPLRVAVLPFYQEDSGGIREEKFDSELLVDNLPLVSSKLKVSPASTVQSFVQERLRKTGLDAVSPGFVQAQLGHHGFVIEKKLAVKKILETPPKRLCELLLCDAILYGKLTRWTRSYYGVQSVNTVGIELKLVRAADGKLLFQSSGEDSRRRGLTGLPTGFSSIAVEPILGLDNSEIVGLSEEIAEKIMQPLYVSSRPEFLNSMGPAIFGATHTGKVEAPSEQHPLTVLVLGTPKSQGYFTVGRSGVRIPLFEQEEGHYVGEYVPLDSNTQSASGDVMITLRDSFGRKAELTIPKRPTELGQN